MNGGLAQAGAKGFSGKVERLEGARHFGQIRIDDFLQLCFNIVDLGLGRNHACEWGQGHRVGGLSLRGWFDLIVTAPTPPDHTGPPFILVCFAGLG